MRTVCFVLFTALGSGLRSQAALQIENAALRHQLAVLQRQARGRPRLRPVDRMFWTWLCHLWPGWRHALVIVKPDTVLRWHRRGFRLYWRWKSRPRGPGRPRIPRAVQELIRQMCRANPTWGAPRIHGELLKLGITIAEATVGHYMVRRRPPPSQTWRTFLTNHVSQLVSVDFFVVPTFTFRVLFVFVVLAHDRRQILHVNVTGHPTAAWTAHQIRHAFPWDTAPRLLLRDRDGTYGVAGHLKAPKPDPVSTDTTSWVPCSSVIELKTMTAVGACGKLRSSFPSRLWTRASTGASASTAPAVGGARSFG